MAGGGDAGGAGGRGRGRRRVSFSSFLPHPPALLPSPGRLGSAQSPICKTRAGGGSGAGAPARPRECQADVVGHLKFTEGGGRVKVMVSRVVCECVSAADGRARSISPSRNLRGGAHARGPRGCRGPGGHGGTRAVAGVASKGTRGHSAPQTFLFSSPFPVRKESTHWARVELFFSLPLGKKNAPVQSFLRLPARGSEDNITYVIYMHIKSLAGGCVCRKILCEEEKAAQSGRARREAPRCDSQKTRSSWWKCACTWPVRAPLSSDARGQGGEAGVPGERHRGRLALLAQNGLQCSLRTCP